MEEIWKEIKGFDGRFSISNLGRVKQNNIEFISLQNKKIIHKEKIIKPFTWQSRYLRVDLISRKHKKRLATYVHKLVAEYFIGPRPTGYEIDHIDGNYLNNSVDNLRYVTKKENMNNPNTLLKHKGQYHTEETRKKISDKLKVVLNSPDVNKKLRKKHKMSLKGKQILSQKLKEYNKSNESRKKKSDYAKNRLWVNNNIKNKFITKEELEYYLSIGYKRGFLCNKTSMKGRAWINNKEINKLIKIDELEYYLNNGWTKGRLKKLNNIEN